MIFFTGDNHFYHKNIIKYCKRPYEDIEQMNRDLIDKWNEVVSEKGDLVYHLGDFGLLSNDQVRDILKELNGFKVLIRGNHDKDRDNAKWIELGFDIVFDGPIIFQDNYVLSHRPTQIDGYFNIHAHTHDKKPNNFENESYCVSVDMTEFKPISLIELEKLIGNSTSATALLPESL